MAYQIAICDDEPAFCTALIKHLRTYENETGRSFDIKEYHCGKDLISDRNNGSFFHLLFLDIEFSDQNGIDIARQIRRADPRVIIVFVTVHDNFALLAYDVDAIGYLVKPLIYSRFKFILDKSMTNIDFLIDRLHQVGKCLTIKVQSDTIPLPYDDIIYLEKIVNRIDVYTENGVYSTYEAFKSLKTRIDGHKFPQVHQGYIINFDKIKQMTESGLYVTVSNEKIFIPVSRRYYSGLSKRHKDESIKAIYRKRPRLS